MEEYAGLESFGKANDAWIRVAQELGETAVRRALAGAGLGPQDVDALFFVTVTGVAAPTIDARLMNRLSLRAQVDGFRVYGDREDGAGRMRVIDHTGLIRLQRRNAIAKETTAGAMPRDLEALWAEAAGDGNAAVVLMHGLHLADLTGLGDLEQALAVAGSEVSGLCGEAPLILLASVGA
jgi:alkylresorcinol/alkylpyrone synthase